MSRVLLLGETTADVLPFPPVPTRAQVCGVTIPSMNSCPEVVTVQYGTLPYFEPVIGSLRLLEDRQAAYAAKHAMGDTHAIVGFSSVSGPLYDEIGTPYQFVIEPNQEDQLPVFLALIEEVIQHGFTPLIALDGDDGDHPYRGSWNALRQLPILLALLRSSKYADLTEYCLIGRMWDGVFYGSSPENIAMFGRVFRQLCPNGYLAIEHSSGHIPCGEGSGDWQPGAAMSTYDTILSEFDYANDVPPNDTIWQIGGRLLGPAYRRPADQPAGDDPHPPWYLAAGTTRGPWFPVAFEWLGTYWRVRERSTIEQEATRRAYLKACGWTYTG